MARLLPGSSLIMRSTTWQPADHRAHPQASYSVNSLNQLPAAPCRFVNVLGTATNTANSACEPGQFALHAHDAPGDYLEMLNKQHGRGVVDHHAWLLSNYTGAVVTNIAQFRCWRRIRNLIYDADGTLTATGCGYTGRGEPAGEQESLSECRRRRS